MPWVVRESRAPSHRLRRSLRRWTYDHGPALTSLSIGGACVAGVLAGLKVAGLMG